MFLGKGTNASLQYTKNLWLNVRPSKMLALNQHWSKAKIKHEVQMTHYVRTELTFNTYLSVATTPLKIIRLNSQKSATTDRDLCGGQVINKKASLLQECCKNSSDWLSNISEITRNDQQTPEQNKTRTTTRQLKKHWSQGNSSNVWCWLGHDRLELRANGTLFMRSSSVSMPTLSRIFFKSFDVGDSLPPRTARR